ncbi:hypothetical protein FB451DRAFT_1400417 [Mycena latifolia]|nr:hypothetical protein FB451DRAFT_1400417 [Mycena latifolia]
MSLTNFAARLKPGSARLVLAHKLPCLWPYAGRSSEQNFMTLDVLNGCNGITERSAGHRDGVAIQVQTRLAFSLPFFALVAHPPPPGSATLVASWPASLKQLELIEIPRCACGLHDTLRGPLSDARVLAIVATWSELTTLSLEGAEPDLEFFKCVTQHCGALRTLRTGYFPGTAGLPALASAPVLAHPLKELTFMDIVGHESRWNESRLNESRWNALDLHLLARHLDRMFPQVETITGEGYGHRWAEVAKLVSLCQDVRRTAWEQQ